MTAQKKRRSGKWLEIFAAGQASIRLPVDEIPSGLSAGTELTDEEWTGLAAQSKYFVLLDSALRILSRRDHFTAELKHKLSQREKDQDIVSRVIQYCVDAGYIDDARALDWIIEQLVFRGGIGPARVKMELYRAGCPASLIGAGLDQFQSQSRQEDQVSSAIDRKRRHFEGKLRQLRDRQKKSNSAGNESLIRRQLQSSVYAYLSGRGFSSEICSTAATGLTDELMGLEKN